MVVSQENLLGVIYDVNTLNTKFERTKGHTVGNKRRCSAMFERNVLLVFPNKKCATVEREKCTMEHQTIFQQLKQYNTSSEPIPSAQCDECTKLLIQALTTSANVAHMMSAQERAEYKEVMKRFFARLKEVMTEKNVMDIEKVLQNSLLWFLAPFW